MGEFMLDSDVGPDIYLHLANNHELSREIYDAKPHEAIDKLRELETKGKKGELDTPAEGELQVADPPGDDPPPKDPPKPGKKTKAPDPPDHKPEGQQPVNKSPEDESMDEYAARRQNEERARKGLPPI